MLSDQYAGWGAKIGKPPATPLCSPAESTAQASSSAGSHPCSRCSSGSPFRRPKGCRTARSTSSSASGSPHGGSSRLQPSCIGKAREPSSAGEARAPSYASGGRSFGFRPSCNGLFNDVHTLCIPIQDLWPGTAGETAVRNPRDRVRRSRHARWKTSRKYDGYQRGPRLPRLYVVRPTPTPVRVPSSTKVLRNTGRDM